ncbi:MAG: DUF3224 domain-containing protein [Nannocystaceae bacterium]|nr:DUF3224 domain-containing protein [Nannocystaceae bacterium]
MLARGRFDVEFHSEPPFDEVDGVTYGRTRVQKRFAGDLQGTSVVHMLGVRTKVAGSAAYVALERVDATLDGRRGSFALIHRGVMSGGAASLTVEVAPDSGTGELAGLRGSMTIENVAGEHSYVFDWELSRTSP